jgi:hypothetical protein
MLSFIIALEARRYGIHRGVATDTYGNTAAAIRTVVVEPQALRPPVSLCFKRQFGGLMKNIGRLLVDLVKDGYSVIGILAPLLSISVTVAKALDVPLAGLRGIS